MLNFLLLQGCFEKTMFIVYSGIKEFTKLTLAINLFNTSLHWSFQLQCSPSPSGPISGPYYLDGPKQRNSVSELICYETTSQQ
jgi:hypothetical protein